MTCPASFTQRAFRGRNDDGNETTATWKGVQNANWTQAVDTNFRVRFCMQEGAACAGNNKVWRLQYNLNSAGWVDGSATSSVVRASDSANFTDGAATTEQLTGGTGTFQGGSGTTGGMDDVSCNAGGSTMDVAASGHSEAEFCVQIRSADVVNNDSIQLRVTDAGTALASYTQTPTITVQETVAATLNAEPATFTLTGANTTNVKAMNVDAAAAAFTLTGFATTLPVDRPVNAESATFTLSGVATGFTQALSLNATAASFALTGADTTNTVDRPLNAAAGAFALTGADTANVRGVTVNAEPAVYSLTGLDITFTSAKQMDAAPASFAISGAELAALRASVMQADPGSYTINGMATDLTYTPDGAPPLSVNEWLIRARRRARR